MLHNNSKLIQWNLLHVNHNCTKRDGDFVVNFKQWGGFLIHTPKTNPHCPLSAILLSVVRFFNRYSTSFLTETVHSKSEIFHSAYSTSRDLAAGRFLVKKDISYEQKKPPQTS